MKDYTNQTINGWNIIGFINNPNGDGKKYICICPMCKKQCEKFINDIKISKSCMCQRKKSNYHKALQQTYTQYSYQAKRRSLDFNLTKNQVQELVNKPCYYCGQINERFIGSNKDRFSFKMNGIDRIDSSIGYEKSNCVSCCFKCNHMKSDYTVDEFLSHISLIAKTINKK